MKKNKKMRRRIFALLVALMMCVNIMNTTAYADNGSTDETETSAAMPADSGQTTDENTNQKDGLENVMVREGQETNTEAVSGSAEDVTVEDTDPEDTKEIAVGSLKELQEAVEQAGTEPKTIRLTQTVYANTYIWVKAGQNITLTAENGAMLVRAPGYTSSYVLWVNGNLTLENIVVDGNAISATTGLVFVASDGSLSIEDGAILKNAITEYGAGIYNKYGTIVMNGGSIQGNKSVSLHGGAGVYNLGTFTMNGGSISGNNASGSYPAGGGVRNGGTFTMNGGTISGNSNAGYGGGIYNTGTLSIYGNAVISGNSNTWYGGGIYTNGVFFMDGGTVQGNCATSSSSGYGGGIYCRGGSFTMKNATVSGNTNGGIYISTEATETIPEITNVSITGNIGTKAALYISTVNSFTVSGCTISDNNISGSSDSDVVIIAGGSTIGSLFDISCAAVKRLENCTIRNNVTTGSATVSRKGYGELVVSGCTIEENTAKSTGAIYNNGSGNVTLEHTLISLNQANTAGGIQTLTSREYTFTIRDSVIKKNKAVVKGAGGIYLLSSGSLNFESGALYDNESGDNALDFYSGAMGSYSFVAANQMYDSALNKEDAFASYAWQGALVNENGAVVNGKGEVSIIAVSQKVISYVAQIGEEKYETLAEAVAYAEPNDTIHLIAGEDNGLSKRLAANEIIIDKPLVIDLNRNEIVAEEEVAFDIISGGSLKFLGTGATSGTGKIIVRDGGSLELEDNTFFGLSIDLQGGSLLADGSLSSLDVALAAGQHITLGQSFRGSAIRITLDEETYSRFNEADMADSLEDVVLLQGCVDKSIVSGIQFTKAFTNKWVMCRLDEAGNIVLHKSVSNGFIYLDGKNGNDENNGLEANTAVKTFQKAKDLALANPEKVQTIYVVGQITVSETEKWSGEGVVLLRYPSYTGSLVVVDKKATLTLQDVTLDGASKYGTESSGSLIEVKNGSTLVIEDGAVLQNNNKMWGSGFILGGAIYASDSTVTMNGGMIQDNSAHLGGGIALVRSQFVLKNGKITGNTADETTEKAMSYNDSNGGGVFLSYGSKMQMDGGIISDNYAYHGGGIAVGCSFNTAFIAGYTQSFEMNGGTIDNNKAASNGGGIWVQMNGEATINAGYITNNSCQGQGLGGNYGGAGIYVNGGKDSTYKNGVLHLYNVDISDNTAGKTGAGKGAVLAGCPTSEVKIYLTNGARIHDNNGTTDLYVYSGMVTGGYQGLAKVYLSPFMLGGGAYHWMDENGNELSLADGFIQIMNRAFLAKTMVTGDAVTGGDKVTTYITGNKSSGVGGAIGTNGSVIIGTADEETVSLGVEKTWNDAGYEEERPDYVDIRILAHTKVNEAKIDIGYVRLTKQNGWQGVTIENLPKYDENGNEFIYTVEEVPNGYWSEPESMGANAWAVNNTPVFELKLEKAVEGSETDEKFTFQITVDYTGEIKAMDENGEPVVFTDGSAVVKLANAESMTITFIGLPKGTHYTVKEECGDEWKTVVNGNATAEAEGTVEMGREEFLFTNTLALGSLSITKYLEGAPALEDGKEYIFTFRVTGPDYSETVQVAAGKTVTLSNLRPGIYTVVEDNAEIEGYIHTVKYEVNGDVIDNTIVAVSPEKDTNVVVTNTYSEIPPKYGQILLQKMISGGPDSVSEKVFSFTITGPDGYFNTVTITGEGSQTITGLVPGEYTITEANAAISGWNWTVSEDSTVTVTVEEGKEAVATIKNQYDEQPTPTPTVTPTPAVTPTPEVTPTPTPEVTPTPTPEATPTPTPEVTPEPTPEVTPEPTPEVTPTPTPEIEIPNEEPPLGNPDPSPTPTPEIEIPDEEPPLGNPDPSPTPTPEIEIPEEETPLADGSPKTGDSTMTWLWAMLSLLSAGIVLVLLPNRKRQK